MKPDGKKQKIAIVHPVIDAYMDSLAGGAAFPPEDETVSEMETLARERDFPIVGRLAGRFLFQQALMLGARRIFELGSGFGYSAYWFAKAAGQEGRIFCTDRSPENAALAAGFMKKSGLENTVLFRTGDALEILRETEGEFDIIFCDADKESYPEAFAAARGRVRKGGLFIADNAFWDGGAARPGGDPASEAVALFNKTAHADAGFLTVQVPVRDGLSVSLRLGERGPVSPRSGEPGLR